MMSGPITTIDLGNSSSSDAVATPWEETRRVLETAEVFWLATVRADGRPHVTPVAAAWLDGTLYFGTGSIAQKFKNLRGNPHVVLTTGSNHLATGFDIMVEGDATPVTDTAAHERDLVRLHGHCGWPRSSAARRRSGQAATADVSIGARIGRAALRVD